MKRTSNFASTVILILAFILLAIFVSNNPINNYDIKISKLLQQYQPAWLNNTMVVISAFGEIKIAVICLIITAIFFFAYKYKREGLFTLAIAGTGIVTFTLKRLFNRPRPTAEYVNVIESYKNNSFPSGHTLSYVVFFGFLIFMMKTLNHLPVYLRNSVLASSYFMIIMGPISRIYLGAHWLTDIIGGSILGILYLKVLTSTYKTKKA